MAGTLNASVMEWHLAFLQHFQMFQGTVLQTIAYHNVPVKYFLYCFTRQKMNLE